jgi:hypothetical protein
VALFLLGKPDRAKKSRGRDASNIEEMIILAFELGDLRMEEGNVERLTAAFEAAGVEFTNADEPGVKLRKGK